MTVLILTDPVDSRKILFNWDNVIAIKQSRDYQVKSTVRTRDGTMYDVLESMDEIEKRLQEAL